MKAYAVIGLGFGDEGKGKTVDWLCRQHGCDLVVKSNGGSNAGHNVVAEDGRHHCFSQYGSGSFVPRVKTLVSRFCLFDPLAFCEETKALSEFLGNTPEIVTTLTLDAP